MTKSLSTAEIKACLSESIDLAIKEGFVTITRYGKPVAAIVSIEDLEQLQRLRAARLGGGLANLAQKWEDADEFAQELDRVVRERHESASSSSFLIAFHLFLYLWQTLSF